MPQSTVIFIPFDAAGKAITLQSTFEELKARYRRRRVAYLPPHITVDTIGQPKHLVLSMWTDATGVRAESKEMADAMQQRGRGCGPGGAASGNKCSLRGLLECQRIQGGVG